MRWTERQQLMLREMGLRLWAPGGAGAAAAAGDAAGPAPAPPVRLAATVSAPQAVLDPPPNLAPNAAPNPAPRSASPRPAAPASPADEARAPAAGLAQLDWPALREAVPACRACGLCETRQHTVFGLGHPQAHCMLVGEAPGEQEDRQGEPFVGAAGQLLDRMLAAIGLTREQAPPDQQVFITNTLKCRPPRNRNPTPEELAACRPFLARQLALVQPKVVVAMGRFAVQSLLATDEPIGRLRGRVHDWQGRQLVVTYHPAYLLRQPSDKAKAWDDLCLVADLLGAA